MPIVHDPHSGEFSSGGGSTAGAAKGTAPKNGNAKPVTGGASKSSSPSVKERAGAALVKGAIYGGIGALPGTAIGSATGIGAKAGALAGGILGAGEGVAKGITDPRNKSKFPLSTGFDRRDAAPSLKDRTVTKLLTPFLARKKALGNAPIDKDPMALAIGAELRRRGIVSRKQLEKAVQVESAQG